MTSPFSRGRLLAGAALGFGLALVPQQAQAACSVVGGDTWLCATNTTTTDTTGVGPTDRNPTFFADTVPTFLDVDPAVLVDGYGIAWVQVDAAQAGTFPTTITNDGTIQVNAGAGRDRHVARRCGIADRGTDALVLRTVASGADGAVAGNADAASAG